MKGQHLLSFALDALRCSGSAKSSHHSRPLAGTINGTYAGSHDSIKDIDLFLGIPYAQPPVEALRFQVPQPLNTSWSNRREATNLGAQCVGYGSDQVLTGTPISEDCLTLNVFRPAGFENKQLPVAVWIHGGNYQFGSNSDPRYDLRYIVHSSVDNSQPIIAVGINYRLEAWGFLFSKEVKNAKVANLALRDQRAALAWIQENIAGFGGDPSKVTIWGESAGAQSVGHQLLAYNGRDDRLFRAAIMQSGASIGWNRLDPIDKYQSQYDKIVAATGCSKADDTLQCLRYVPFKMLNDLFNSSRTYQNLQYPVVDGDFLLQPPTTSLAKSQFVKVPIIVGANFDEGALFAPQSVNTDKDFRDYISQYSDDLAVLDTLEVLYPDIPRIGIPAALTTRPGASPGGVGLQFKRAASVVSDHDIHGPRRLMSETWAANNLSSYSYHFNVQPNGIPDFLGACHFMEVAFALNNVDGVGYVQMGMADPFANVPASYKGVAKLMSSLWVSFIYGLDPNGALSEVPAVKWPVYSSADPQNYVFEAGTETLSYVEKDIYRAEAINYWTKNYATVFGQ